MTSFRCDNVECYPVWHFSYITHIIAHNYKRKPCHIWWVWLNCRSSMCHLQMLTVFPSQTQIYVVVSFKLKSPSVRLHDCLWYGMGNDKKKTLHDHVGWDHYDDFRSWPWLKRYILLLWPKYSTNKKCLVQQPKLKKKYFQFFSNEAVYNISHSSLYPASKNNLWQ